MSFVRTGRAIGIDAPRRHAAAPPRPDLIGWCREPVTWIVVLVVALMVVLAAHDRIARTIGTASPTTALSVPRESFDVAPGATASVLPDIQRVADEQGAPLPDRAPRDPFAALVSAAGQRVHPAPLTTHAPRPSQASLVGHPAQVGNQLTHHKSASDGQAATATATSTGQCAATHVVRAGESLWSIAALSVNQSRHSTTTITQAWQRIYAANHAKIGGDPGMLAVGVPLCLPT